MNLQDRYAAMFLNTGCVEVESKTRRYRSFIHTESKAVYFLGKAGAVRYSKEGKVSTSFSVKDSLKARLLAWERNK